jgi:hypothetical protein
LAVGEHDHCQQYRNGDRDPGREIQVREPAEGEDEQDFLRRISDRRQRVAGEDRQGDPLRQQFMAEPISPEGPADQ